MIIFKSCFRGWRQRGKPFCFSVIIISCFLHSILILMTAYSGYSERDDYHNKDFQHLPTTVNQAKSITPNVVLFKQKSFAEAEKEEGEEEEEKEGREEEEAEIDMSPYSNHYLMKLHLLQEGVSELLSRWKNSPLSQAKPLKIHVCQRYLNESKEVKVNVLNVWKDSGTKKKLTLVTQLGISKLPVLERLLQHWTGPLSFALYCDEQNLRLLPKMLIHTNSSLLFRDNIVLHLVYESGEFYPVNFLRNLVLNNTKFEYAMLTDVDFMPSFGSYEYILAMLNAGKLPRKHAFVVPAYEFPRKENIVDYPKSKQELIELWLNKTVTVFHHKFYVGHRPTNYKKWAQTNETYEAKFADAYEPYVVIDTKEVPPYPQCFVGRLGNKIGHLLHVHSVGYQFIVLPAVFMVHYPHPVTWHVKHFMCAKKTMYAFKDEMKELRALLQNKTTKIMPLAGGH